MRAGAMVATVAAAPETCALYLGSEVWGTGATEGTKLEVSGWVPEGGGFTINDLPRVGKRQKSGW